MSEIPAHHRPTPISRRRFVAGQRPGRLRRVPRRLRHGRHLGRAVDRRVVAPPAAASSRRIRGAQRVRRPDAQPTMAAELNWANWTALHGRRRQDDRRSSRRSRTSRPKYGTEVNYQEVIDDNDDFFGTIRPQLQAGQDTGWDLIVVTDWMAARLIRLGWVEKIDLGNLPNVTPTSRTSTRTSPGTRPTTTTCRGSRA